jgi:hypothetical protein
MRAVVVYESMFGNTRAIAEAIAAGLRPGTDVTVVSVARAKRELVEEADLVVVGGPTHVHGMSQKRTRASAAHEARQPGSSLVLDADAEGTGLREWFAAMGQGTGRAASFDTRLSGLPVVTGRASRQIGRQLRRHGFRLVARPQSFLVFGSKLLPGEAERAREWASGLPRAAAGSR